MTSMPDVLFTFFIMPLGRLRMLQERFAKTWTTLVGTSQEQVLKNFD